MVMIKSYDDYKYYLLADKIALNKNKKGRALWATMSGGSNGCSGRPNTITIVKNRCRGSRTSF